MTGKLYQVIKTLQDENRFMEYKSEMYINKIKQLQKNEELQLYQQQLEEKNLQHVLLVYKIVNQTTVIRNLQEELKRSCVAKENLLRQNQKLLHEKEDNK